MRRVSRALGVVVPAALLGLLGLPAVSSAIVKTECCFMMLDHGYGKATLTWTNTAPMPPASANVHTGSEQYEWNWESVELDEYSESDGFPSLERAALNFKEIPGLDDGTRSSVKANEIYWAAGFSHRPNICNLNEPGKPELTENDFTRVDLLSGAPAAVQRRFKGHKYVLQLVSAAPVESSGCFDSFDFSGGLQSPPGANGFANEDEQPEGPGDYYVTLPPRAYLRHGQDQSGHEDVEEYHDDLNFSACLGAAATTTPCIRYTLTETTTFRAHFTWFPEALLRREAKRLDRSAAP